MERIVAGVKVVLLFFAVLLGQTLVAATLAWVASLVAAAVA